MVRASSLAEVSWVDRSGEPHACRVLALARGPVPVLALTFDRSALARSLLGEGESGSRGEVALSVTDPRGTAVGFSPVALRGRPRLVVDGQGEVYLAELLVQELRRYPPARLLADSPLLCREHWWFLPRLLVELPDPSIEPLAPRCGPGELLLVTAGRGGPALSVVQPRAPEALETALERLLELEWLGGAEPASGRAVLFAQDASFPDLERWEDWCWRGRVEDSGALRMAVRQGPAQVGLPGVRPLLQRWRAHRALERGCREGLRSWLATR